MHCCVTIRYGPWHKEDDRMYHYGMVLDNRAMRKYATTKQLLMRMDRHMNRAMDRIGRYGITPLPSFENGMVDGHSASPYRVMEWWSYEEFYLRRGNWMRWPLQLCGTPSYEHDRRMENKSHMVIRNLHVYCSCAAIIITMAVRRRAAQLKATSQ